MLGCAVQSKLFCLLLNSTEKENQPCEKSPQSLAPFGTLLTLGCINQAYAGQYVLQGTTWIAPIATSPAASAQATATTSSGQYFGSADDETFSWIWQGDNAADTPQPLKVTFTFSGTTGKCIASGVPGTYAENEAWGAFANVNNMNGLLYITNIASAEDGPIGVSEGETKTVTVFKIIPGAVAISQMADVATWNVAAAVGGDPAIPMSTAATNATSAELTGVETLWPAP